MESAGTSYDSVPRRQFSFIPAKIINASINKQFNFLTLDKGRHHGLEPEMAVISPRGVVGVVYSVSGNYASVIGKLISYPIEGSIKLYNNLRRKK